jgi:transcriptional regulator with XRE-family HTH domain
MPMSRSSIKPMLISTKTFQRQDTRQLLKRHQFHDGLYARIAEKLHVNPSYVSRVARGERESPGIVNALLEELRRIEKA